MANSYILLYTQSYAQQLWSALKFELTASIDYASQQNTAN